MKPIRAQSMYDCYLKFFFFSLDRINREQSPFWSVSAYGDDGVKYRYSGTTVTAKTWTNSLLKLKYVFFTRKVHFI